MCKKLQHNQTVFLLGRFRLFLLIWLFGPFIQACDSGLPPVSWEGSNVRFANGHDVSPCGSTLLNLDDTIDRIEELLNMPLPTSEKITYYWLPAEEASSRCGGPTDCSSELVVISKDPIHVHELVHAVTSYLGPSHAFLYEGLAVAFGELPVHPPTSIGLSGRIRENFKPYLSNTNFDYELAGMFAKYLLEHYGIENTKNIISLSAPDSDYLDMNGIFLNVIGLSLDDVLNDISKISPASVSCYMPSPGCDSRSGEATITNLPYENTISIGCSSPIVQGPFSQDLSSYLTISVRNNELQIPLTVEIIEAGTYSIDLSGSSVSGAGLIRPCSFSETCNWNELSFNIYSFSDSSQEFFQYFSPGYYQFDLHFYSEGTLSLQLMMVE